MRTMLDIALNDLRIIFKDRSIYLNIVVIPIVLAVVVGFANGAGDSGVVSAPTVRIDVIDHDNSPASAAFLNALRATNANFVLCPADQTDDDICRLSGADFTPELAQTRLVDRIALAQITLPADFGDHVAAGENVSIIYRSNDSLSAPSYILQAVQTTVTRASGAIRAGRTAEQIADEFAPMAFLSEDEAAFPADVRARAETLWATDVIAIDYQLISASATSSASAGDGFGQSFPGMATMYVMFAVLPAVNAIIQERKNWTLQRLATLPISRTQIMGGKLLARFIIGMIQYAIMFGFGLLLGVNFGNDPLALLLVMISYTLCITALTLALTTILKTESQAAGITLLVTLTLAPLGGAWWPLEIVPSWMATAGHISPVAWAMDAYRSLIFYNGGLGDVIVPIAVLLVAAGVLFTYGAARFKFTN